MDDPENLKVGRENRAIRVNAYRSRIRPVNQHGALQKSIAEGSGPAGSFRPGIQGSYGPAA